MHGQPSPPQGPDLRAGVALGELHPERPLRGHVDGAAALMVRHGDSVFVIGAMCPHRGAPLDGGLVVDGGIRCPFHHACFALADGALRRPPALAGLPSWEVVVTDGRARAGALRVHATPAAAPTTAPARGAAAARTSPRDTPAVQVPARDADAAPATSKDARPAPLPPRAVIIVGAGAAGHAAAVALRAAGYSGRLTLLSGEAALPYDRTGVSKELLASDAPPARSALHVAAYYRAAAIDLRHDAAVALDTAARTVRLGSGTRLPYDRLLLATGSTARRPPIAGAALPHVHTLRSLEDVLALRQQAAHARRVVIIGGSFIGMEAAAALTARRLEVHVVTPDAVPLARALGPRLGRFLLARHVRAGVHFHLGSEVARIHADAVSLAGGARLPADLVVLGVGAVPELALARAAGLPCADGGVVVGADLQVAETGVYVAGDICRWPDPHGGTQRSEHWVVAQRQGSRAAHHMLGTAAPSPLVPFFWTRQHGVSVALTGTTARATRQSEHGDVEAGRGAVASWRDDGVVAVATVGNGHLRLQCEHALEHDDQPRLRALLTAL